MSVVPPSADVTSAVIILFAALCLTADVRDVLILLLDVSVTDHSRYKILWLPSKFKNSRLQTP